MTPRQQPRSLLCSAGPCPVLHAVTTHILTSHNKPNTQPPAPRHPRLQVRLTRVLGFSAVTNVSGGMQAWQREGLPMQLPMDDIIRSQQKASSGGSCGCSSTPGGGCKGGNKQ